MGGDAFLHVPDGWSVRPLIDCTDDKIISYGIVQPGSHQEDGIPIVRVNNIANGRLDVSSVLRVTPSIERKFARTRLNGGEVLLTLVGSTGQSIIAPDYLKGWNVPRAIAVIRADDSIGARWINICLQTDATRSFLDSRANTTVQKTLNLKDVRQIPILVPPENTKTFIESTSSAFDDKIELNRQMNATLESMAQALFKSWFVDFDPVIDNALAAGNPIPEPFQARAKSRKALGDKRKPLPEALQQQFPSSFVFTEEMGWIPEGWSPLPLNEAIEINPRVSLKIGSVAKYVDMKALPTSGYTIDEVVEGKMYSGGAKFENGDILLARITPCLENGKTGVVDFLDENVPGFGSTEFIILRSKGEIKTPFIAALARDEVFRQHCIVNMVGSSGRQRVQNSCFNSYYICHPDEGNILKQYHELCSAKFSKITSLRSEIWSLTRLRDTLLPKLLSGQLRIPDAEKFMADAL